MEGDRATDGEARVRGSGGNFEDGANEFSRWEYFFASVWLWIFY